MGSGPSGSNLFLGLRFRAFPTKLTWRFMGSYTWGYMSPNRSYNVYATYNPLIIAHEPPSRAEGELPLEDEAMLIAYLQ